jgi:GTP cyclohydrolase I
MIRAYDQMVVLCDIRFVSDSEHHVAPVVGRAHFDYRYAQRPRAREEACGT